MPTEKKSITATPGPWTVLAGKFGLRVEPGVAAVLGLGRIPSANADLIAAAPDLLAACLALRKYTTRRDGTPASYLEVMETFVEDGSALTECLELARAALLKAEGAQQ